MHRVICEVLRPFEAQGGEVLGRGTIVDVTDWPHQHKLVAQRFLRPVPFASVEAAAHLPAAETPAPDRPVARRGV